MKKYISSSMGAAFLVVAALVLAIALISLFDFAVERISVDTDNELATVAKY